MQGMEILEKRIVSVAYFDALRAYRKYTRPEGSGLVNHTIYGSSA